MNAKGKGLWWISPLAMAVALAACGGDSDNDRPATGGDDGDGFQASPLLVMHNGSGNASYPVGSPKDGFTHFSSTMVR